MHGRALSLLKATQSLKCTLTLLFLDSLESLPTLLCDLVLCYIHHLNQNRWSACGAFAFADVLWNLPELCP